MNIQRGQNLYEGLNGFGVHVVFDTVDNENRPLLDEFLEATRPAVLTIVGAATRDQAFAYAAAYKAKRPQTRVGFRNFENETGDDGNWKKHPYAGNAARWFEVHQRFMDAGLSVLTDNESSEGDFTGYVDWELSVLDLIAPHAGYQADFMRQAVGWPGDGTSGTQNQYPQFKRLYKRIAEFPDGRFSISPNEYYPWDEPNASGHLGRYHLHYAEASFNDAFIPNLFIGEFAGLYRPPGGQLDAQKGWSSPELHLDGVTYIDKSVQLFKTFYQPFGIPVNFYCWGDSGKGNNRWKWMRIDQDRAMRQRIMLLAQQGQFILPHVIPTDQTPPPPVEVTPPPPPPIVVPPVYTLPAPAPKYTITFPVTPSRPYLNLRAKPLDGMVIGRVLSNSEIRLLDIQTWMNVKWAKIVYNDVVGWVSTQNDLVKIK